MKNWGAVIFLYLVGCAGDPQPSMRDTIGSSGDEGDSLLEEATPPEVEPAIDPADDPDVAYALVAISSARGENAAML